MKISNFIGAIKIYDVEQHAEFISNFQKKVENLVSSENVGKKDKEAEKKKLTKAFLDEIHIRLEKHKLFENYNFFEPLIHQNEFVVIKPITIFVFTAVDDVRSIFNKDFNGDFNQLLSKKEDASPKKEEKEEESKN